MESRIWNEIEKHLLTMFDGEVAAAPKSVATTPFTSTDGRNRQTEATIAPSSSAPEAGVPSQQSLISREEKNAAAEVLHENARQLVDRGLESTASSRNLDEIKRKYIVGKLSGKEIRDAQGRIIVGQNEMITEEIVDLADQSGKLVELIVHMTIQL